MICKSGDYQNMENVDSRKLIPVAGGK